MEPLHYKYWPNDVPRSFTIPKTTLAYNLDVSAVRFPDKTALSYYGTDYSFLRIKTEVDALAGYLQEHCGIKQGDRVLLYMQNSPQFVIGYYAILRANAVIVPANPMNLTEEIRHYVNDAGVSVAICGAELRKQLEPLMGGAGIGHVIVTAYGDYVTKPTDFQLPDAVQLKNVQLSAPGFIYWNDALTAGCAPETLLTTFDDLAAIIYTSGTTGKPKGCMHTHHTLMANTVYPRFWIKASSEDVSLGVVPFFHVTGMQIVMNTSIYVGAELVIMTRWDRELALQLIQQHGITKWINIPTMVIDLLASKNLTNHSLSSLTYIGGGGAAMPESVARKLHELTGLSYCEGYGLTETSSTTHANHSSRPKRQCLGIPIAGTESMVIDPDTLKPLCPNETGEIVILGPQLFTGYWNQPEATSESFFEFDGKSFFRTGDLGYFDEDGYFFLVDRLKRMINASGFKVWPAEIESMMYDHPEIQEACIISTADPHRGETVKALVVLKESAKGKDISQDIVNWCKERMSAYKYPRIVECVDELPKSGSGKVQWRLLQERENSITNE